jgi:hypothetical protein
MLAWRSVLGTLPLIPQLSAAKQKLYLDPVQFAFLEIQSELVIKANLEIQTELEQSKVERSQMAAALKVKKD